MRFYAKLVVIIWIAMAIQRYVLRGNEAGELWFGLRCEFAYVVKDQPLMKKLIAEASVRREAERRVNAAGH